MVFDTMPVPTNTLQKITELLDCSIESLTESSSGSSHLAGAAELLTLWFEIDDAGSQEQLLRFARRLSQSRGGVASAH